MKNAYQKNHAAHLGKIVSALPASANDVRRTFVQKFYDKVPVSDLEKMEPKHAIALAESAFEFMQMRKPGMPAIRIFNPTKKSHGYDSPHTIVELINDDSPFLIDSLTAELARHGLSVRETIHPIFKVIRDDKGKLLSLAQEGKKDAGSSSESFIHFEITVLPESLSAEQLETDLKWVLEHIRLAVADWRDIVKRAEEWLSGLSSLSNRFESEDITEVQDFMRWLVSKNFIFLGYSEYDFYDDKGKDIFRAVPGRQLGILKITDDIAPRGLQNISPELRKTLQVPQLIEITKSSRRSPVHRAVPMDYIGMKRFDAKGNVIGEIRFLGLFTSTVYYQSTETIPLVRHKVAQVMERADFDPVSHDGKSLKTILEFLPRDELLQMHDDELFETSMGILALEAKPGVRMFVRKDMFERFLSVMVFVPREQFSTDLRQQIQAIVDKAYGGVTSAFSTQITEATLARLHLIVKTSPGDIPSVDVHALEQEIAKRAYLWSDLLLSSLMEKFDSKKSHQLHRAYAQAFPQGYINRHDTAAAIYDINKIEEAYASSGLALDLYRDGASGNRLHLKIYNPNEEIALSDILPMLENSGFRVVEEHPFLVTPQGREKPVWIRDFRLQPSVHTVALEEAKLLIEEMMIKVWRGEIENDRFNALALRAGLPWQKIVMLRAYARYLKQIGFAASQMAIENTLNQHPVITRNIAALFDARFSPDAKDREEMQTKLRKKIEEELSNVSNAAEDRILRRYLEVILATLRTNFYQQTEDKQPKSVLSFKLDCKQVPELPLPRPHAEIFVYSPRVEGIHLRGGKVARGGLRWSDRHEDFRTEVLGLMKAQMVKNSVIVPVGSKGGFVVKRPPATRDAYMEEGIACYKMYLSGLLDLTDNIVKGKIVPPKNVVRQDGDDPYLVVAADKGTATFSDIANSVSEQYGFWLGDAFASGGSVGYDHKKMGITARGGWVSVTRHFREMGMDIAKEDFTCVGVGDMAGDVFGNGMLLSEHIRLLAAFNHMHIFIDPNPDAKASFKERKRLFKLPRSTWKDYDESLISKGGGIYDRSAKSIEISKEAQAALGLSKSKYAPDDLIRALLAAEVDLLWNGGIGTYVKSESETNEQVGDRANNALRVNGKELRCKVVGEGGNLGFTQKGRIEYAKNGGRINTDAIDNSAGVDCSDHEVNIKIAYSSLLANGKLSVEKRNKQLADMTDEVAELVLKDNILQTQAITIAEQLGVSQISSQRRLMRRLEQVGLLNRAIEFLPTDEQLNELRVAGKGLTRPEIAVLLAYSKMQLFNDLLATTLPDEKYFLADLRRYFPKAMCDEYGDAIEKHPLKREIIATVATNSMVNRAGITFFYDLVSDTGASIRDCAMAYTIARDAFGLRTQWNEIETLGGAITPAVQAELYSAMTKLLERASMWLITHFPLPLDIDAISKEVMPGMEEFAKIGKSVYSESAKTLINERAEKLMQQAVPEKLARHVASLPLLPCALDIIAVSANSKLGMPQVGKIYFALDESLGLGWLRSSAESVAASTQWDRMAAQAIVNDLYNEQRRLTSIVIDTTKDIEKWMEQNQADIARFHALMDDIKASGSADLARLMVALGYLRGLGSV